MEAVGPHFAIDADAAASMIVRPSESSRTRRQNVAGDAVHRLPGEPGAADHRSEHQRNQRKRDGVGAQPRSISRFAGIGQCARHGVAMPSRRNIVVTESQVVRAMPAARATSPAVASMGSSP
jgi:hypothetical protein